MTRKGVRWSIAVLLVMCIFGGAILWAVRTSNQPNAQLNLPFLLGSGLGLWLISGLIPVVWLAFRKFRVADGSGPLKLWWGIAIALFIMNMITANYESNLPH